MAIKSILTASVLSVIGAAVSTAAFADNMVNASTFCKPGFYAGVQGGRSDTFYHPSTALSAARNEGNITTTTYNANGTVASTSTTTSTLSAQHVDDVGMGGRLYAGYQFNPYFALETGYTQYNKTDFSATGSTLSSQDSYRTTNVYDVTKYNGEITEHAIDLVGKATLPLQMGFGLYAKAGMAYIAADSHTNLTVAGTRTYVNNVLTTSTTSSGPSVTIDTHTYQGFRPVAGVGVNYTIPNTNFSVDASYTRVFSYGGIPNALLASLGLEYKFA